MTIYFILPGYAPDAVGGYRVVYDYALAIQKSGWEDVIVYHSPWPLLRSPRTLSGRAVAGLLYRVAKSWIDKPSRRGVPWYPETKHLQMRFTLGAPRIRVSATDAVIATSAHTAPFVLKIQRDAVAVYFIQHVETWSAGEDFVASTWQLPLSRIVIAPWLRAYGESLGVESQLVLNAIDGRAFAKGPPLVDRGRRVVSMMSPLPFKRADLIIDAFSRLHAADPDIDLVAFGAHRRPTTLPDYVSYIQSPGRAELANLYASSRVYLCASDAEGWHLPPGEALMCGTAVASTDIGGVRVVAGDDALYSPPGDAASLAASALRLLDDPELAQRLVDGGESRLRSYSPVAAAAAFYEALDEARSIHAPARRQDKMSGESP